MITIAIPTYNSGDNDFKEKFRAYPVLIIDNGSTDGSEKLAHEVIAQIVGYPKRRNIARVRKALAHACYTEHIFYLDSDIEMGEAIEPLLEHLKDDVGMVGYCINDNTRHLQMGNALLRADVARKVNWDIFPDQCNCLNAKYCLSNMGLITKQIPSDKVIHLRRQHGTRL